MVDSPLSRLYAPYNYILKWYIEEEEVERRQKEGHHFIIAVDTSDGIGGDDISFVVRDHVYGDVICAAAFNEINLITLAGFFVSFLLKYSASTMIIERRSSAASIIDYIITKLLSHGINPFSRLYNTIYQNKDQMRLEYEELSRARTHEQAVFDKYRKHIGFVTSGSGITARSELYSVTLIHMLKFTAHLLRDQKLIDQIAALVIRNNRVDHPVGGNDDMVIGGLLSYWFLITGKNLQLYGIDTSMLLRQNDIYLQEKYKTDEDSFNAEEVMALEEELKEHIENYKRETNPVLVKRLELKIRHIASSLQLDQNVISVEEMLENLYRDKRLTRTY